MNGTGLNSAEYNTVYLYFVSIWEYYSVYNGEIMIKSYLIRTKLKQMFLIILLWDIEKVLIWPHIQEWVWLKRDSFQVHIFFQAWLFRLPQHLAIWGYSFPVPYRTWAFIRLGLQTQHPTHATPKSLNNKFKFSSISSCLSC